MTETGTKRQRPDAHTTTAAVVLILGLAYGYQAIQEGIGTLSETGAGFFPLLVSFVLVVSSGVVLVESRRGAADDDPGGAPAESRVDSTEDPGRISWRRVFGVLAAALSVPLLAATVGFVVTLSAAVVVIAKIMGMPGLLKPLALGVGFGAAAWLVFVYWLFVPLPSGVLGFA